MRRYGVTLPALLLTFGERLHSSGVFAVGCGITADNSQHQAWFSRKRLITRLTAEEFN